MTDKHIGARHGRWTVVAFVANAPRGETRYFCRCDCGEERTKSIRLLLRGASKSCGCLRSEVMSAVMKGGERSRTHGKSRDPKYIAEYNAWSAMRARCRRRSHPGWASNGGRGIVVCEQWGSFEVFLTDMGARPEGQYDLGRLDKDADYTPENCRWVPRALRGD